MSKKIFYGWWIVLATNVICMLGFGTWLYSFGVFFKPMMAEFGWTRAITSIAASLRSTQGGIAGPIVGWAVDKWGSRRIILFGGILSGLSFALMPLVDSIWRFYCLLPYSASASAGQRHCHRPSRLIISDERLLVKIQGSISPLVMIAGTMGPFMAGYLFDKTGAYHLSFLLLP